MTDDNYTLAKNESGAPICENDTLYSNGIEVEYIFDRGYVRAIFFTLYTAVFCLCFFGNLLVILVVTLSRRLRSITNFFLANLAVADLCVAIFCVYQNLFIYIVEDWKLGEFFCRMYMFIQSLSSTASIFILVIICIERYFAIIYPITCKQILTPKRLRLIILGVWLTCILYSFPKFYWATITANMQSANTNELICILDRTKYNSKMFDIIHFVLFYNIPLIIMSLLYSRIAVCLWNSSQQLKKQLNASTDVNHYQGLCRRQSSRYRSDKKTANGDTKPLESHSAAAPASSHHVLAARQGVIKMLIVVVCAFAVCNIPYHARKMWQYTSAAYDGSGNFSAILTPLTCLCTYFNSAINPLLYAFLSKNFRRGMREILMCTIGGGRRPQGNRNHLSLHVGMQRNASTRSTLKANTTVTIVNNEASSECSHDV